MRRYSIHRLLRRCTFLSCDAVDWLDGQFISCRADFCARDAVKSMEQVVGGCCSFVAELELQVHP